MNTNLTDDTKLYRFIPIEGLLDHLLNKQFVFIKYKLFDDPWEGFYHKGFHEVNDYDSYSVMGENRPFIMCFTKRRVSEAMWRIYSRNAKGAQIVTTVGRLKNLVAGCYADFDCYLKKIIYNDDIEKEDFFVKNFPNATMQEKAVECLFRKKEAFDYEEEVRLVLYSKTDRPYTNIHPLYSDPNDVIESIILDPRIDEKAEDLQIRTLKKLDFKGIVAKSKLYSYKTVWYKT